jgi:two-component system OmpR family sensor kinase
MARINDEAARLGRLVDDLLTLARLDERRPTRTDAIDLAELARSAVDDHLAAHPGESVELDAGPGEAAIVHGDRDALRQVLTNLLANTHNHTPPGTPVRVRVGGDLPTAWMSVADEGPGIDPETASRIFDRFYRADRSRSRNRANSGLGLSIVAAIVTAHHGTIDVDPSPGVGATFTIRIPTGAPMARQAGY